MKCPEEIGTPLSLKIWHDNSGGNQAGWYLGKVVFVDLQQKRWLESAFNQTPHKMLDIQFDFSG